MPDDGRAPLDVLRRIQRRRLQLRGELAVLVVSIREAFGRLPNEHVYEELFLSGSVEQLEAGLAELQPWRERLQEQHEHPPDGRVENRGRRRIEEEPEVLEDHLRRAREAEQIKRQHPERTWADIAALPEIGTDERRLREWRALLKSGGKKRRLKDAAPN